MSQLRLYTEDGTYDIHLTYGSGSWFLPYGEGSVPASPDDALAVLQSGQVVQWSIPLLARTDSATFSADAQTITTALERARNWRVNTLRSGPLWLGARPTNQTSRRFLVLGGYLQELSAPGMDMWEAGQMVKRADLVLYLHQGPPEAKHPRYIGQIPTFIYDGAGEKHPAEGPVTYPAGLLAAGGDDISAFGGVLEIAGAGTRPGRIATVVLNQSDVSIATLTDAWLGIKPATYEAGAATTFNPVFNPATYGTPYTWSTGGTGADTYDQATINYNSGAYGNMVFDSIPQVGDTRSHYIGEYVVLMRYAVTAVTGSPTLRLRLVNYGTYTTPVYLPLAVTSNWTIAEIGRLRHPGGSARMWTADPLFTDTFDLQGNMIASGTDATFRLNRLFLVPYEHYVRLSGMSVLYNGSSSEKAAIYRHADDAIEGVQYSTVNQASGAVSIDVERNWYLPVDGGVLVVVAANSSGHLTATDTLDLGLIVHDRYSSWKT